MSIQIRRHAPGSRGVREFIQVAHEIYRSDPAWVAPLDLDMKMRLTPKSNPFFEHAECALFVAERHGDLVGRVSAQVDHEHLKHHKDDAGFFGFLDTVDDPAVAKALLESACAWLRERGMKTVRGPLSLSINEEAGTLVEGFDTPPMIMMPHHRPYQGGLIEAAGFTKVRDLYAWKYEAGDLPPRVKRAQEGVAAMPEVRTRQADPKNLASDVRDVVAIFNDAWSDNWGFVPMTQAEVAKMGEDFKLILIPELALLVDIDGEPAAVALALPNLNEATRDLGGKLFPLGVPVGLAKLLWRLKVERVSSARVIILGIKKKFRAQKKYAGLSLYLYAELNDRGRRIGVTHGELSWTLEDNGPVNAGIRAMGGKVYKRYRVYEKPL